MPVLKQPQPIIDIQTILSESAHKTRPHLIMKPLIGGKYGTF